MLTGLRIHIDEDDCNIAEVAETCKVGDLMGDILGRHNKGQIDGRSWSLIDGVSGRTLRSELTLGQNQVKSGQDLYMVPSNSAVTHDLELEVVAPGGQTMRCEVPSSLPARLLSAQAIQYFHLDEIVNEPGRKRWILVHGKHGRALNPDLTLTENAVASGQRLLLEPERQTRLLIFSPDGEVQQSESPPITRLDHILTAAIAFFRLPGTDRNGAPIEWRITRKNGGVRLDPTQTLAESGLASGEELLVEPVKNPQPEARPELPLYSLRLPGGEIRNFRASPETIVEEIIKNAIKSFALEPQSNGAEPVRWLIVEEGSGRSLDATKTLSENGLRAEGRLALRAESGRLSLRVVAPNNEAIPVKHRKQATAGMVLGDALERLHLPRYENDKKIPWEIRRKDSPEALDDQKTLGELGIVDGDILVLAHPEETRDTFGEFWSKYKVPVLVACGVLVLVIIVTYARSRIEVKQDDVVVVLTPSGEVTLSPGETAHFKAQSGNGTAESVAWSFQPHVGTLSNDGVYAAPPSPAEATQQVTIIATSTQDNTKSARAVVTLLPDGINLEPRAASLKALEKVVFTAKLREDLGSEVVWKLEPEVGTIGLDGTYTAPSYIGSPQVVRLMAASKRDSRFSEHADISLFQSDPPKLLPLNAELGASELQRFSLTPNPNATLEWHIHPAQGTISKSGVYTAPALIPDKTKVWITATMVSAPGEPPAANAPSAVASVTLRPVSVSGVTCAQVDKHGYSCAASVSNTPNKGLTWSVSPDVGTIAPNGLYTTPSHYSAKFVSIIAASVADPTKRSQSTLALAPMPEISVIVAAPKLFLFSGQGEQFTAAVNGTSNQNVAWYVVGPGNLYSDGRYMAPPLIKQAAKVRVIAKSQEDTSKQGEADITLVPYTGATEGTITWRGQLRKGQILTLNTSAPSLLTSGAFPGVPVIINVLTPNCVVESAPSEQNGWKTIQIRASANQRNIAIHWRVP